MTIGASRDAYLFEDNLMRLLIAGLLMLVLASCAGGESRLNYVGLGMDRSTVLRILGVPDTRFAREPYEYYMYELTKRTSIRKGATCGVYGFITAGLSWINCADEDTYFVRFEDNQVEAFGRMGDFTPANLSNGEPQKQEISVSNAFSRMVLGQ